MISVVLSLNDDSDWLRWNGLIVEVVPVEPKRNWSLVSRAVRQVPGTDFVQAGVVIFQKHLGNQCK
jgi:hypothetical protein